jgi:medium-chain acyl-[acyl-carrier-protein] hydrolase
MTVLAHAPTPRPHAVLRLFCFPYAGGSSLNFAAWPARLPPEVELVCIDPPGRRTLVRSRAFDRLPPLVDAVCNAMLPWLDRPYALFGHSNGALTAFEVGRRLAGAGRPPALFIASAKAAPSRIAEESLHLLSDTEFLDVLRGMGGTPDVFFRSPELQQLLLPMLRADFALSETYEYRPAARIACRLALFGGRDDNCMGPEDRQAWAREFEGAVAWQLLDGGHFFMDTHPHALLEALGAELAQCIDSASADRFGDLKGEEMNHELFLGNARSPRLPTPAHNGESTSTGGRDE